MTKDPLPGSGKYGPHTFYSGLTCMAVISLFFLLLWMFLSLKVGLEVSARTAGRLRTHSQGLVSMFDTRFMVGLHCTCVAWILSFSILLNSVNFFLTRGWTGGVHTCFGTTKDPQPGIDKCNRHTFCSGLTCVAVISLNTVDVSLT